MGAKRKLILLAFAIATFATLRFTMGPRSHGPHSCSAHQTCGTEADKTP